MEGIPTVFLSYSKNDVAWRDLVAKHLQVAEIVVWHDGKLEASADADVEIRDQMESCALALLLVSADYLSTPYILEQEIPVFRKRRKEEFTPIVPLIIKDCAWTTNSWLKNIQARPKGCGPLASLTTSEVDHALGELAKDVFELLTRDRKSGSQLLEASPTIGIPTKPPGSETGDQPFVGTVQIPSPGAGSGNGGSGGGGGGQSTTGEGTEQLTFASKVKSSMSYHYVKYSPRRILRWVKRHPPLLAGVVLTLFLGALLYNGSQIAASLIDHRSPFWYTLWAVLSVIVPVVGVLEFHVLRYSDNRISIKPRPGENPGDYSSRHAGTLRKYITPNKFQYLSILSRQNPEDHVEVYLIDDQVPGKNFYAEKKAVLELMIAKAVDSAKDMQVALSGGAGKERVKSYTLRLVYDIYPGGAYLFGECRIKNENEDDIAIFGYTNRQTNVDRAMTSLGAIIDDIRDQRGEPPIAQVNDYPKLSMIPASDAHLKSKTSALAC